MAEQIARNLLSKNKILSTGMPAKTLTASLIEKEALKIRNLQAQTLKPKT